MTFPTIQATNESSVNTAGTSHAVSLPAGIHSGDLLIVILGKGSTAATIDALAGWNELADENAARGFCILARDADGSEGATITLTSSASTKSAHITYRISGAAAYAKQPPELSTVNTGTSTDPDPTTCTPTGGAKDYLWIATLSMGPEELDDDTWCNSAPASFTNLLQKTSGTAGTNIGAQVASAQQNLNAASLDAGTFNVDTSSAWRAFTIAVHPGDIQPARDLPHTPQHQAVMAM